MHEKSAVLAMGKSTNDQKNLQQQRRQDNWKTTYQETDKSMNILESISYTDTETTRTMTGNVLKRVTVS